MKPFFLSAGWTLSADAHDIAAGIDLTYIQRIYMALHENPADLSLAHYPALRNAFQRVSDLDFLAEKVLQLCSAMKRGVWLRESDLGSPVDHNLNLDIFQIASSLRGHISTGWVSVRVALKMHC